MIYFNPNLAEEALKVVQETQELSDILRDLNKIHSALSATMNAENLLRARMLDNELQNKYPTIDKMIGIANRFPVTSVNTQSRFNDLPEHTNLKQDYYGILCDVLLKKQITTSIEEFIKSVD